MAEVFVPTRAYHWAWETLRDYHFVVLDGPPEVGKTAIAWMIALGQLLNGWQVIVCDEPSDFFGSLREGERQLFVCDDAFGRTEYDPARGRKWENQLERVLKRVDANHWFVWTTRKHIFERGLRELDFQGATHFRKAGTLVDAAQLSTKDKALILYRHAKAAGLADDAKQLLRQNLETVIHAREFTPERIRRFVQERLLELTAAFKNGLLKVEDISREVSEAIRNPTDRMRKTFQRLSTDHKWVLISLFECGRRADIEAVALIYRMRHSDGKEPFNVILDELREGFVRVIGPYIDWIHPSYRDLVIEELAADQTLRQRVLISITLSGLKVAVSDTSGPYGEQKYPLIVASSDWKLLEQGCLKLVDSSPAAIAADALHVLGSAAQSAIEPDIRAQLGRIIYSVCETIRQRWDSDETKFTADQLLTFCQSSLFAIRLPLLPRFEHIWSALQTQVLENLDVWESNKEIDCDIVQEWIRLTRVVAENEPRFLRQINFPAKYREAVNRILGIINLELDVEHEFDSSTDYVTEAYRCKQLVGVLEAMQQLRLIRRNIASPLQERLEERSDEYSERASELDSSGPDYYDDDRSVGDEAINLNEFFKDL